MSHHPRIEEVSDSDSDPPEMDPSDFDPRSIISPANFPPAPPSAAPAADTLQPQMRGPSAAQLAERERTKNWQCLYPVYFDANRSKAEGRRVGKEHAVLNPLARTIVDAVQSLGLQLAFEPGKTHPKDWANPGRVRVLIKQDGKQATRQVKNKSHLYILVAEYLKAHPTTPEDPLRLRVAGLPMPKEAPPPPAIPRGWKMNTVIPLHSAAASGGGVSDNFFKDMMAEMQGETPGGSGSEKEGGKKKKDKKGKGKA